MFYVKLCSFGRMVVCVLRMSLSGMRVVSRGFVIARLMVLRSVAMMFRCARVMLRCIMMVLGCLFRHLSSSSRLIDGACRTLIPCCYFRMTKM
jgi:hypothetical protein